MLPIFWKHALLEWSKINFKKIDKCSKDSLVICNSLLNARTVFDIRGLLPLYNSGIRTFEDFLSTANQSPTVRRTVIQIKKVFDVSQFANSTPVCDLTTPISMRAIGKFILSLNQEKPQRIWVQWAQDTLYLPLASEWHKICALRRSFVSIRFQAFYWRFINVPSAPISVSVNSIPSSLHSARFAVSKRKCLFIYFGSVIWFKRCGRTSLDGVVYI